MTSLRPTRAARILAAGALLALSACDGSVPARAAGSRPAVPANNLRPSAAQAAAREPEAGAFLVAYPPPGDPAYEGMQDDLRGTRFLEDVAEWLNGWIALPEDVTIAYEACGEPNAFYDPDTHAIAVCYELVEDLERVFAGSGSEDEVSKAVGDALLFTVLHEVGHALVDVLGLPITGREEDAADQLAALILVDGSEEGNEAAVNGVIALSADEVELDAMAFADEHGLGEQRFYNVVCLVYGQDPAANEGWVAEGWLPETRAERCPDEYQQVATSWDRLLADYLRN